jgi:hypothetical protein
MNAERTQQFLFVYSGVVTFVFAACVIAACATASRRAQFEEIDVQRIPGRFSSRKGSAAF